MFTVLIAEKEYIDAIQQENKLYFEPFLENKELAFCTWNPKGQTLNESVPGLYDIVDRRKEWRAIIINSSSDEQLQEQNPFDVVDYEEVRTIQKPSPNPRDDDQREAWEASWQSYFRDVMPKIEASYRNAITHPLQKLATWLCFCPTDYIMDDVVEKQDVYDWAMLRLDEASGKSAARLEELEREHYRWELRLKERLRREFMSGMSFDVAKPSEVYCISERIAENGFFHPESYWNDRKNAVYSEFVERNMYFDKMRFLVFDVLSRTHRNYRCDQIHFLYTLLVFATNDTPGGALQPRRLYLLESTSDDTPLCVIATSYDRKLAATNERIENEVERLRSELPGALSDKEAESRFCMPTEISVPLDKNCDLDSLMADNEFGLSKDCPNDEERVWDGNYKASKKALNYIVRLQVRSVKKSVEKLRYFSEVPAEGISRLTPFQMSDIRDFTNAAEDEMVASIPGNLADFAAYSARMEEKADDVQRVLEQRMSKKTTISLGAVCLAVALLCWLPLLFGNLATTKTVAAALGMILGMLVILAAAMLISLFVLRRRLSKAVGAFNEEMTRILNNVKESLQAVSTYLSEVCAVRRGHTVLNYSEHNMDEFSKQLRIRRKHQADIRKTRACLEENYCDFIRGNEYVDASLIQPYDYDFDLTADYQYPAPFVAGDYHQIEFLESGNLVTVPSGYVTRISVRMEEIYDK